jgi:hypothetical protein
LRIVHIAAEVQLEQTAERLARVTHHTERARRQLPLFEEEP